ncbi:MAG: hypothetical protein KAS05_04285 [Candidatus Omnitrophica bacterium]|nr:hypothetical protein [Candidatus Omnitrophota bacterium]
MDKTKIIPIILLVVVLGVGYVAFTFYTQKEDLTVANQTLAEEKIGLVEANSNLQYKVDKIGREKTDIERRLLVVTSELSNAESDMENWQRKWSLVSKERDTLVEKMKVASSSPVRIIEETRVEPGMFSAEDHWADFVKSKASAEAKLDILSRTLFEEKNKMAKLDKENKELSIQMDQLAKEKNRLIEDIKFKERTLRIMSMDLVSEREGRGTVVIEVKKLRRENGELKREVIMANKGLMKLQDTLQEVIFKKEELEEKISDADVILKEKAMAFEELQSRLEVTIEGGKRITAEESASVELPPIIVKPNAQGIIEVRGEIIAVNHEEKFVVIDIGEASGLRPGALLKIMRGGRKVGTVEVIEMRKEISAADVKEVVDGYVVQEGDIAMTQ